MFLSFFRALFPLNDAAQANSLSNGGRAYPERVAQLQSRT